MVDTGTKTCGLQCIPIMKDHAFCLNTRTNYNCTNQEYTIRSE